MITKEYIIELNSAGLLDMAKLSARRISALQVIIEVKNKSAVDILSAPMKYKESKLIDVLLHYFTLPDYALRVGIQEKSKRNSVVINFFNFLESKFKDLTSIDIELNNCSIEVPSEAIVAWRQYLLTTTTAGVAWRQLNGLRKILNVVLNSVYGKISRWPEQIRSLWVVLKANTPKTPISEKTQPLGMYLGVPEDAFSDDELYMGLRYGSIWLLNKLAAQRNKISQNPVVVEILLSNKGKTQQQFEKHFEWSRSNKESSALTSNSNMRSAVFSCIREDELLTEWQCYSFSKIRKIVDDSAECRKNIFLAEYQQVLLSRYAHDSEVFRARAKGLGRNDSEWQPLKKWLGAARSVGEMPKLCFWGSDLVAHSSLERLLMVWLLASERAQRSGIEGLVLDSVSFSGEPLKSLQISTLKLRRATDPSAKRCAGDVGTQIYKRNEPPFIVYKNWHVTEERAYNYFSNHNRNRKFIFPLGSQISGIIIPSSQKNISTASMPLALLATPGTAWSSAFLIESGNSREAKAFIAILENRLGKKRLNPDKNIAISASFIGQSLVVKKEIASNLSNSYSEIESDSMGHALATGRNVYKDGFSRLGIKEIIEPIKAFARKVGDEKILLAEKLAIELSATVKRIDFAELEKLCGVKSASSQQRDLLMLLDEQDKITMAGEVSLNGELLVVESDFTAALMFGYIKHLEKHLPEVMSTDRDESALRYLSQYLYLNQIYQGLDPHIRESGQELAEKVEFPFPTIN